MPKIPTFQSTRLPPGESGLVPISGEKVAAPYGAIARAGEQTRELGLRATNVFALLDEREKKAQRETKAMELGQSVDDDFNSLAEKLSGRNDYEVFQPEMETSIKDLRQKYQSQLTVDGVQDRDLSLMFDKYFNRQASIFKDVVRKKKLGIITERGQMAFFKDMRKDLSEYAMTQDPDRRMMIKNDFEIKANSLIGSLFTADQVNGFISNFEKNSLVAQKTQIEEAKGKVREQMITDPDGVLVDLLSGKYDKELITSDAKADMLEKAQTASKIRRSENEKKLNEQIKLSHDRDEREVGDLFMKGDFAKAYVRVQSSPYLTGDEKRVWANGINTALKERPEQIDPAVEISEMVKINSLLSKDADPDAIRKTIIFSTMKPANKKGYLDKLEKDLSQNIKDGRNEGYREIQKLIIPRVEGITMIPKVVSPKANEAIMKAQTALDAWIDGQVKANKSPMRNEIRDKAWQFGLEYQIPFAQALEDLQSSAQEEMRKVKEAAEKKVSEGKKTKSQEGVRMPIIREGK